MRVYGSICPLRNTLVINEVGSKISVPITMPPFHATNAAKTVSTSAYGTNDGRISGKIFGMSNIDRNKSPDCSTYSIAKFMKVTY